MTRLMLILLYRLSLVETRGCAVLLHLVSGAAVVVMVMTQPELVGGLRFAVKRLETDTLLASARLETGGESEDV